jgi:putative tributyrin esterase
MALIHCNFRSNALEISTEMYVILPDGTNETKNNGQGKLPVLFLLHGLSDDCSAWIRQTSIERYVNEMRLAVVMPSVNRSFYNDMKHGSKYWTFISEELPEVVRNLFHISEKREDNFAAGLSMGGYGAFKLALRHPDRFAAAASLSGAVDICAIKGNGLDKELKNIFGDLGKLKGSSNDLFHLADEVSRSEGLKPLLYQCCGTEDFLYTDNIRFRDFCSKLPFDFTYEEEPGIHEWGYWDKKIQRVLEWLPLKR